MLDSLWFFLDAKRYVTDRKSGFKMISEQMVVQNEKRAGFYETFEYHFPFLSRSPLSHHQKSTICWTHTDDNGNVVSILKHLLQSSSELPVILYMEISIFLDASTRLKSRGPRV
ncbi:hypothetical protein TNCV_4507091 [Trichonephila clavipes]|nr:hypothetical protein TNCV_4507091 [Trichonephila clavipes]